MSSNRRDFMLGTSLGLFGVLPLQYVEGIYEKPQEKTLHPFYPSTDPQILKAVVGAAHTKLDVVKELVLARPELAKATYDWGFGDVESALGAASHMGRKDIAEFLIEHGARPNIFTYAMLGKVNAVKAMIEDMPGIERIRGPHGFTLLFHAQMRLRRDNVAGAEKREQEELVAYLSTLEGANIAEPSNKLSSEEQQPYLGKYIFGDGPEDFFEVSINSMKSLSITRGTYNGRALRYLSDHTFAPSGAPSVRVTFGMQGDQISSLTIHDPSPIVTATRV